ncbi:MAG: T9SS type A sorting domain-containing protein [Alloprevotella sp.]|nr:T9SS type A sorting domain-containing protein [Alloprevotella sp.]
MKRIFTLLSTILVALTSYAQLEITDEAGKVIENGGTIEFKAEETDLGGGFVILDCAPTAPYLTNKGASSANLTVTVTRTEADKLTWCGITTSCLPMTNLQEVRSASLGAGQKTPLQLHADFESGQYATYTANVTARLGNDTKNFTIKFIYADPNGIQSAQANQTIRYNGQALQYHATRPAILNVYSTAGRLVKSERINGDGNLNLNDLNQGVFMYEVVSGGVRTASGKVLVK